MLDLYPEERGRFYQYGFSYYSVLLLVLGNDIFPRNDGNTIVACCMEFSGAIVQASLFGELAGLAYMLFES
jgi:hypothetical protein